METLRGNSPFRNILVSFKTIRIDCTHICYSIISNIIFIHMYVYGIIIERPCRNQFTLYKKIVEEIVWSKWRVHPPPPNLLQTILKFYTVSNWPYQLCWRGFWFSIIIFRFFDYCCCDCVRHGRIPLSSLKLKRPVYTLHGGPHSVLHYFAAKITKFFEWREPFPWSGQENNNNNRYKQRANNYTAATLEKNGQ